jgi:hypothetical protein
MQPNMDGPLERAIATLNGLIDTAKAHGLGNSALFLEMAKLQVQLDFHGITDEEFAALCDALESGAFAANALAHARAGYPRPRREGDLRTMGRAWQCPQGAAPPRRRRRALQ